MPKQKPSPSPATVINALRKRATERNATIKTLHQEVEEQNTAIMGKLSQIATLRDIVQDHEKELRRERQFVVDLNTIVKGLREQTQTLLMRQQESNRELNDAHSLLTALQVDNTGIYTLPTRITLLLNNAIHTALTK